LLGWLILRLCHSCFPIPSNCPTNAGMLRRFIGQPETL
jgi:hypothetical protein